jgi:drug/metabolite transporter (DMT)-like permease
VPGVERAVRARAGERRLGPCEGPDLPTAAIALALSAAVLHAVWNLLLARAPETQAATAATLATAVALYALPALLTWDVGGDALPFILGSAAFELGYVTTLAAGLSRGDLSVVYPLARGSAPVIVLAVSAGLLGAATSAPEVAGIAVVAVGVLLVRGIRRPGDPVVVGLALACGACIAYTVVDSHGIERASALPYLWCVMALTAVGYLPLIAMTRGADVLRAAFGRATAVAGVLFFAAYLLVLAALRLAEPGPVAAVRESSVVIAAFLGYLVLREPVTRARAAGAAVVVGGVALIALG